jgi:hypothetical protein
MALEFYYCSAFSIIQNRRADEFGVKFKNGQFNANFQNSNEKTIEEKLEN